LVNHDLGVGQRIALPLATGSENNGSATGRDTHAISGNRAFEELHGVVDGQGGGNGAAGAIDVEADFLVLVFVLKEEKLLNRDVGKAMGVGALSAGFGRASQEDNAFFQEKIAKRHLPLPGVVAIALIKRAQRRLAIHVKHEKRSFQKRPAVQVHAYLRKARWL